MKSIRTWVLALAAAFVSHAALAQPVTVSGVKYDETTDVKGSKLVLNGAGVRYKFVVKVYTAGLYLQKKAGTTEEVLAAPGAKRMAISMLRDIDSAELGKLFSRGIEDNMDKPSFSKLIPGVLRMGTLFAECKNLKAGDTFMIDWVPGTGTIISINSTKCFQQLEPFKEPEFYNALLRIWLGPVPADYKLKDALLGKPAG